MQFRTSYGPVDRVKLECKDPSRAKQSMKDECDINFIMAKYKRTGVVNHLAAIGGDYGDFENMDFHTAMNTIIDAKEMFETVPSDIRKRFHNDPGEFLSFVTNADNLPAMRELGLANAVSLETPLETPQEAPAAEA